MYEMISFLTGIGCTAIISFAVVCYLRPRLQPLLVDLCGTQERANFWSAFSNVTLVLVPVVAAMHYRPDRPDAPLLFVVNDQLKWALIGLIVTVVTLGLVISRFIPASSSSINRGQPS
jgi:hypothetical protein